jgi:hypothetical protein
MTLQFELGVAALILTTRREINIPNLISIFFFKFMFGLSLVIGIQFLMISLN